MDVVLPLHLTRDLVLRKPRPNCFLQPWAVQHLYGVLQQGRPRSSIVFGAAACGVYFARDSRKGVLMPTGKSEQIHIGGLTIEFLIQGADSGGSVAVFEFEVAAGAKVPVGHSHDG